MVDFALFPSIGSLFRFIEDKRFNENCFLHFNCIHTKNNYALSNHKVLCKYNRRARLHVNVQIQNGKIIANALCLRCEAPKFSYPSHKPDGFSETQTQTTTIYDDEKL